MGNGLGRLGHARAGREANSGRSLLEVGNVGLEADEVGGDKGVLRSERKLSSVDVLLQLTHLNSPETTHSEIDTRTHAHLAKLTRQLRHLPRLLTESRLARHRLLAVRRRSPSLSSVVGRLTSGRCCILPVPGCEEFRGGPASRHSERDRCVGHGRVGLVLGGGVLSTLGVGGRRGLLELVGRDGSEGRVEGRVLPLRLSLRAWKRSERSPNDQFKRSPVYFTRHRLDSLMK